MEKDIHLEWRMTYTVCQKEILGYTALTPMMYTVCHGMAGAEGVNYGMITLHFPTQ